MTSPPSDSAIFELRRVSDRLLDDGHPDFAVIAAQTACEVFMEFIVRDILLSRSPTPLAELLPQLVRGFSPSSRQTQSVWTALS